MSTAKDPDGTWADFLRNLCMSETYSDAVICIGNERIPVHRIILASQSRYFQKFFSSEDSKLYFIPILQTDSASGDSLKLILRYYYLIFAWESFATIFFNLKAGLWIQSTYG